MPQALQCVLSSACCTCCFHHTVPGINAAVLFNRISYEKRQRHAKNAAGRKLLNIIAQKQSNLAVAADVATIEEMLTIADQVIMPPSHHVSMITIHMCMSIQYPYASNHAMSCIMISMWFCNS